MKIVVITGSTRGIGDALARFFLERGCGVVVSGRGETDVDAAVARHGVGSDRIFGQACDVTVPEQVQHLWDAAVDHFWRVDIWINNAGIANGQGLLWEQDLAFFGRIAATNLAGTMTGSAVAIRGMLAQGGGAIYNMEGLGSDGRKVRGMTPYGATKRGMRYLDEALAEEVKGTSVIVGGIMPGIRGRRATEADSKHRFPVLKSRPTEPGGPGANRGMVVTDMLLAGLEGPEAQVAQTRRIFTILADRLDDVAPWIVDRVLANKKNGVLIRWLTTPIVAWRFLSSPFSKRDPLGTRG
ncbi:MAG: SDR family NAD(P)-dependent oxidoreductase [Proteobacteria bacterium]|jgi:NAD(P)-dependent dehydrogenase (short-subunit alcohol dehydrogenase family)|nr:SDR family NAD(P)-dependent oxidoreductase [Pseudomonadota bacterium]